MRVYVTGKYDLYLFGGRNAQNATNYIQYLDLKQVFEGSAGDSLTTVDRMEPMKLNRVLPFVDFPLLNGERCIMVFGGQDLIDGEYVPTEIPVKGLQLYCNDVLVAYLQNSRRRLQTDNETNKYQSFDLENCVNCNSADVAIGVPD